MRIPPFARSALAVAALVAAAIVVLPAQDDSEVFDPTTLQEIRLTVSTRDLQKLRDTFEENTYYAADFQWQGFKLRNVGIRSRGRASRVSSKLGLQVDFNRYIPGQKFLGLKALVLDNLWQDPSAVKERVSMALFNRMGVAAPRVAFARLYINNEYAGLYGAVEAIDSVFVKRAFQEEENGYLFEYKNHDDYAGAYLGDELDPYKELFEPRTHEKEPDSILYSPFRDLFRNVTQRRSGRWDDRIAEFVNIEQLIKYVAVEAFLVEDDGFLGMRGMSNFYVYRSLDSSVHRFIPWDKDLTFAETTRPVLHRVEDNELFRRLMAFHPYRKMFYDQVAATAKSARQDGWLRKEIAQASALVAQAVYDDPLKPMSNEEFMAAVKALKAFARERPGVVLDQVGTLRESRWVPAFWDASERQE
jgi:spore coat protein CotH